VGKLKYLPEGIALQRSVERAIGVASDLSEYSSKIQDPGSLLACSQAQLGLNLSDEELA